MAGIDVALEAEVTTGLQATLSLGNHEFMTGDDGTASVQAPDDGDYELQLTTPPEYFIGPATPIPVKVENGAAAPVKVPLRPLIITVQATTDPEEKDAEVKARTFSVIVRENRDTVAQANVSLAKPAKVRVPAVGTYEVVQQTAPRPYGLTRPLVSEPAEVTTIAPETTVTFPQTKLPVEVVIKTEKVDADLSGGKVVLVDDQGGDREVQTTNNDGKATFHPSTVGTFRVDLRSPPPNYWVPAGREVLIEVGPEPTEPVTFVALPSTKPGSESRVGLQVSIVVVIVLVIVAFVIDNIDLPAPVAARPAAIATGIVAAFLLLLTAIKPRRGFFEPLIGADNRASTSRVAPALWTLSIMWALAFLLFVAGTDNIRQARSLPSNRWDDYLILLGGPFAAFVIAKASTAWKVANGQLQKSDSDKPRPADVFQDDGQTTSLTDAQYLGFNLVALVYFWGVVVQAKGAGLNKYWELPLIPSQLLALTSASALTYAAMKAVERNKPVITAISPSSVRPGEEVEISGSNFRPPGVDGVDSVSVTLEGAGACSIASQTDAAVRITIPRGAPLGLRNLVVTSAANVTAEPRPIEIRADRGQLLGVREPEIRPGKPIHLLTTGLLSPLAPHARTVVVGFGDQRVNATLTSDSSGVETAEVVAPRDLDATSVLVTIKSVEGTLSEPLSVPIAQRPAIIGPPSATTAADRIDLRLTVERFLGPDGGIGQAAILVGGSPLTIVSAVLGVGGEDTISANGPYTAPVAGTRPAVVAKDWKGRLSVPVELSV